MSHIVTIKTEVRDPAAITAACERLHLERPQPGTFKLFSSEASGIAVRLPEWVYPVVCQPTSGEIRYDNFQGRWGDPRHLSKFLQIYAAEKAKIEARKRGHSVTEQQLADGSIKLVIQVGGAA